MKPKCSECVHYFITFDPNMPRGCRAYGIKTAKTPSMVVKQANSGVDCIGFKEKKKKEAKKDFNDPKYWKA